MSGDKRVYGLVAEFDSPQSLMSGVKKAYQSGYRRMDARASYHVTLMFGDGVKTCCAVEHAVLHQRGIESLVPRALLQRPRIERALW